MPWQSDPHQPRTWAAAAGVGRPARQTVWSTDRTHLVPDPAYPADGRGPRLNDFHFHEKQQHTIDRHQQQQAQAISIGDWGEAERHDHAIRQLIGQDSSAGWEQGPPAEALKEYKSMQPVADAPTETQLQWTQRQAFQSRHQPKNAIGMPGGGRCCTCCCCYVSLSL